MVTEVEAVVSSRPVTYQDENWQNQPLSRLFDFVQRDSITDYPFEYVQTSEGDETYHPPGGTLHLQTRLNLRAVLKLGTISRNLLDLVESSVPNKPSKNVMKFRWTRKEAQSL
ncbi:hypothetical protein GCK32_000168 [Trichostrongylus colubriformis]|uniref:Uncharacterized protein n=1 Tax=Trichostrongylus colubriformis TaxID=6319 RepID=A0AAN8FSP8_TRICO